MLLQGSEVTPSKNVENNFNNDFHILYKTTKRFPVINIK